MTAHVDSAPARLVPTPTPTPTPTSTQPPPPGAILLLAAAAFASGLSLRLTDPLLPQLVAEFGITLAQASHVVTAFSVAYGLSQLLFGPLGDRYGKYRVVAWACGASALTALLCGLTPGFDSLVGARLLAGATAAAIIPLSMAWIGDVVPYEIRQPVIARFLVGQILGLSTGVLVGGLAADHLGRHLPFFALAAIFAGLGLALAALNKRLPASATTSSTHADGPLLRRMAREFSAVLAKPWARVVLLTVFFEGAALYGAFAFIATHLHRAFGLSLVAAGSVVMLFGLGGVFFAAMAQWLVTRLGEAGVAGWGGSLMALSLLAIAVGPAWWWALPACFVLGLGFYMFHNTLQTNATQMAPERRGAAVAAFASAFFLGQSAGVACAGFIVGWSGTRLVMALGAAGVLGLGLNFSRLRRASQRVTVAPAA